MKLAFEFAKYEIISGVIIIVALFFLPALFFKNFILKIISGGFFLISLLFWLQFFRNPVRNIPQSPTSVVAPADGKIVEIEEIYEENLLAKQVIKIGIFMSPFDCHINRIPVNGTVVNVVYTKGKKLPAYSNRAKYLNENMITHIRGNNIDIVVKQIAGVFARRIKNKLRPGMNVTQGEVFGMILLGSKTEIYIPKEKIDKIEGKINEKVKAGEDVLVKIK
ncbi:MAG: phosphatidylserine decarboxylase [Planctomycetota bacterium]